MQPPEDPSIHRRRTGFRRARALTLAVAGASVAGAVVIADVAAHSPTTTVRAAATTGSTSATAGSTSATTTTSATTYSSPAASSSAAHVSSGAS